MVFVFFTLGLFYGSFHLPSLLKSLITRISCWERDERQREKNNETLIVVRTHAFKKNKKKDSYTEREKPDSSKDNENENEAKEITF